MEDATQLIVGTWRLVHAIISEADGKKRYPFGEEPLGYIYYSDTGIMAVPIAGNPGPRPKSFRVLSTIIWPTSAAMKSTPTGRWSAISLEGQLFAGDRPGILERKYLFEGDLLSLRPVDMSNYEILWQRVRG